MPHRGRLSTAQFSRTFADGRTLTHRWFTLRVLLPDPHERVAATTWGIAVGRRMAGTHVERNRLRRRVAAAIREVDASCSEWVVVQLRREGIEAPAKALGLAIGDRLARDRKQRCTGA